MTLPPSRLTIKTIFKPKQTNAFGFRRYQFHEIHSGTALLMLNGAGVDPSKLQTLKDSSSERIGAVIFPVLSALERNIIESTIRNVKFDDEIGVAIGQASTFHGKYVDNNWNVYDERSVCIE